MRAGPLAALVVLAALLAAPARAQAPPPLGLMDVFELEYASDPQIAPDGTTVVYRRNRLDVQTDRVRGDLWTVATDGSAHAPLVVGVDASGARWSPDGARLAYVAQDADEGRRHLMVRYLATGQTVPVARLASAPGGIAWSPDGTRLAFTRFVETAEAPLATLPGPPEGAAWADAPVVVERTTWRSDGSGYTRPGARQLFVVPAEGGTPRQLTDGPFDVDGTPAWAPDGRRLIVSSDRREGAELDPGDSELYSVDTGAAGVPAMVALTDRVGPDGTPAVSAAGVLAYTGTDDRRLGYQVTNLYVRDGEAPRQLLPALDRDVQSPTWADGRIVFAYDDAGTTRLATVRPGGGLDVIASDVGGTSIGRPYGGGSFSVGGGRAAFTLVGTDHPADVAVVSLDGGDVRRLTRLNDDLFAQRSLGAVEEIRYPSSADGLEIEGWIVTPPGFDPARQYPLVLEIHGGPFANYGPRFSMEAQLFAAAGHVVLYTNPRGSSSYGEAFGNEIHHAYPSQDYDDLMSGVDAVLARGSVDPDRLYVTGGSGGGVLTAWIVGHTDRFRAAVVAKPVINWTSWIGTADSYTYGAKYWFDQLPWEDPEGYWARSPLAYVGNVTTPTMVLTGEADTRTPMSESEQYYQALRLEGVPSALVRVPGASHGIAARPAGLMRKVGYILAWFERYGGPALAGGG